MLNRILLRSSPQQNPKLTTQHHSQLHGSSSYDDVHLSFSSVTYVFIANYTVPRFYQGRKKKAKKWGQVVPLNNQTVLEAVLPNGLASFRINLKTQVRYKNSFWKTRRFGVDVGAEVGVNGDGVKANKKGIRLKKFDSSSSSSLRSYFPVCVLTNLLVLFAIC
uniref:Uncharacterized protein n=1 Tax=Brassica oleracea var. oleracea TaxID=109376 RepID=A0A0D3CHZ3_BRAOL